MLQLPDRFRYNLLCVFGEFVGTFMFLLFSFAGTQVSNTPMAPAGSNPNTSNLLYTSLCFGFSLTVNVWAFFRVTGGLFNPAVRLQYESEIGMGVWLILLGDSRALSNWRYACAA
jgi:aquaporin related protein